MVIWFAFFAPFWPRLKRRLNNQGTAFGINARGTKIPPPWGGGRNLPIWRGIYYLALASPDRISGHPGAGLEKQITVGLHPQQQRGTSPRNHGSLLPGTMVPKSCTLADPRLGSRLRQGFNHSAGSRPTRSSWPLQSSATRPRSCNETPKTASENQPKNTNIQCNGSTKSSSMNQKV
jgi:hypothetical protein